MPETGWPSEVLRSRMPFEFRGRPIAERGVQPLGVSVENFERVGKDLASLISGHGQW